MHISEVLIVNDICKLKQNMTNFPGNCKAFFLAARKFGVNAPKVRGVCLGKNCLEDTIHGT